MIQNIMVSPGCQEIPKNELHAMCKMIDDRHSRDGGRHQTSVSRNGKKVDIVYQNGYISICYDGEI